MTIRKGEQWGTSVPRPARLLLVASDAEAARALDDDPDRPVGVTAGDLHRTIGAPGDRTDMQRLPVDLVEVVTNIGTVTALAHVVARRGWWRGPIVAVMNVDHLGDWNVAPRAHPNDGRIDLVEVAGAMTPRERLQARRRLRSGTHVPHPAISTRRVHEASWDFERPFGIWVDHVRIGDASRLAVRVRPDAGAVFV